jgi:hypothetical protein
LVAAGFEEPAGVSRDAEADAASHRGDGSPGAIGEGCGELVEDIFVQKEVRGACGDLLFDGGLGLFEGEAGGSGVDDQ